MFFNAGDDVSSSSSGRAARSTLHLTCTSVRKSTHRQIGAVCLTVTRLGNAPPLWYREPIKTDFRRCFSRCFRLSLGATGRPIHGINQISRQVQSQHLSAIVWVVHSLMSQGHHRQPAPVHNTVYSLYFARLSFPNSSVD